MEVLEKALLVFEHPQFCLASLRGGRRRKRERRGVLEQRAALKTAKKNRRRKAAPSQKGAAGFLLSSQGGSEFFVSTINKCSEACSSATAIHTRTHRVSSDPRS